MVYTNLINQSVPYGLGANGTFGKFLRDDTSNFRRVTSTKFCLLWKEKLSVICLIFYLKNLYASKKKEGFMHSGFYEPQYDL